MIHVASPGLLTTVQDLGRHGYGLLGVSPSGAADALALRIGNLLAGNSPGAAALEMTLLGGTFEFDEDATIAVAGADFGATLDGAALAVWRSHEVRAGQILRTGPARTGARCYLCVQGGIAAPRVLGSASVHVLSGLGGRPLRRGDVLATGQAKPPVPRRAVSPRALSLLAPRKVLRVTPGPQADWFDADALYRGTYRVSEQSNRMGLRLEGPSIQAPERSMLTEGVPLGAVQVPAGGQPIILFVEQQTTGGYPKIANVIAADLSSVGQLRPRDEVRFEGVTLSAARSALVEVEDLFASGAVIMEMD